MENKHIYSWCNLLHHLHSTLCRLPPSCPTLCPPTSASWESSLQFWAWPQISYLHLICKELETRQTGEWSMDQNPSSSLSNYRFFKVQAASLPSLAKVLLKIWWEHRLQHQFTQFVLERLASGATLPLNPGSIDLISLSSVESLLPSPECSRLPTHVCGQGLPSSDHVFLRCLERTQLFLGHALQDLPAGMYLLPCTHLYPL